MDVGQAWNLEGVLGSHLSRPCASVKQINRHVVWSIPSTKLFKRILQTSSCSSDTTLVGLVFIIPYVQLTTLPISRSSCKAIDYSVDTTIPVEGEELGQHATNAAFTQRLMDLAKVVSNSLHWTCIHLMQNSLYENKQDVGVAKTNYETRMSLAPTTDLFSPSILMKLGWRYVWGM